jgi:O-antigen/teichoic acid export membrane protein
MQGKSKKIVKNSAALYVRMAITMAISLYTSRVVLSALGISDYGIYNVVGGIVMMFSFMNSAMSLSVSRFLGIAMGKEENNRLSAVFKASLNIHLCLAFLIALISEAFGIWYLNNYINVPADRLHATFIVFHMSVLVLMLSVARVPYIASITINEDINVYAVLNVLESILKLLIVYLLYISNYDRLVCYASLILVVTIVISLMYYIYCRREYIWCRFQLFWDKDLYYDLLRFAGLNTFGNMVQMIVNQGQNLLLNFMFGPIVNAARGIAFQVDTALKSFVTNIFTAVNPQLFKSYGEKNYEYMRVLLYNSARLSFAVLLMVSIPIILDIDYILSLWLVEVPEYTAVFIILLLINSLVFANIQPLMLAIHATARIGELHVYTGLVNILNLFFSYLFLRRGFSPEWVFIVQIFINIGMIAVTLYQMRRTLGFCIGNYIYQVYCRELLILLLSLPLPLLFWKMMDVNILTLVALMIINIISVCAITALIGIEKEYRLQIIYAIKNRIHG